MGDRVVVEITLNSHHPTLVVLNNLAVLSVTNKYIFEETIQGQHAVSFTDDKHAIYVSVIVKWPIMLYNVYHTLGRQHWWV